MPLTRRDMLVNTSALVLLPISPHQEGPSGASLEGFTGSLPEAPAMLRRGIAEEVRTTTRGLRVATYARFGRNILASDQWPFVPLGNDVYVGAGGDGIGFINDDEPNKIERDELMFSQVRFQAMGDNIRCVPDPDLASADLAGYSSTADGDDFKPNVVFRDQRTGELYCFIARGRNADRRRAWLITSRDGGRKWDVDRLPTLPAGAVFDANMAGGLTPVGGCNTATGSVHDDGYLYFYFNRQGNARSADLYQGLQKMRLVYCARIPAPALNLQPEERRAHFANAGNYRFWKGGDWGDMAAARPVHEPTVDMGKHFIVSWIPQLGVYVAGKAHSAHFVWLGSAPRPEGPFTPLLDERISDDARSDLHFTVQLLPGPAIVGNDGLKLPLVFSGHPYFDGFNVAKVRFT